MKGFTETYLTTPQGQEMINRYLSSDEGQASIRDHLSTPDGKQAEQALKQKTAELDGFFTVALDPLCIANIDGYFLVLNPALERILGYSRTELMEKKFLDFVHPDDIQASRDAISLLISQKKVINFTNRYRYNDGNFHWMEWCAVLSGTIIYASGRDITERKQAEQALRKANRQLNLLSSITRHDILNKVLALRGYLELSHEFLNDPDRLADFIRKEEQVAETIDQQITFTRDYQELGAVTPAWQNVNASIKKAVAGLPLRDIHVEVDPNAPEILVDPLFDKVFYNLLDNAIRYGGDGMKGIRVSSQESDRGLIIVCEDDGVGISEEDKKRLFTKGFGKHTGLGLFLSREILSITGITITENGTPGKGARFEITVPKGEYRFTVTGEK